MKKIPAHGTERNELFGSLQAFRENDMQGPTGRTWGYVFDAGPEVDAVAKKAYAMFLSINGLDPTVYPSVLKLENDVVAMAASHLSAGDDVVGNFTTGGTESIILAVKTARDHARANRPEIAEPEMILPITAHAAFHKAAHYLNVKPVVVPVDGETFRADLAAVEAAITPSTILLVGSASSYAHGVVDPIGELGQLALDRGLLLHVDGCIGGFLLPYFKRLGAEVPDFDFSVPGVSSISMDLHKYAFCAKGASVVLYRDRALRKHQLFACSLWPGYTIVNTTFQSTKSAGPLAAAWAVMSFIGDDGYQEIARSLLEASKKLVAGIDDVPGLRVLGNPDMTLVAFASETVNLFKLADVMRGMDWYIQPQLSYEGGPHNIHLTLNPSNVDFVDQFLADLPLAVEKAGGAGASEVAGAIRQTFATMDPSDLSDDVFRQMTTMAGIQSGEVPDEMAEINEILDALPPEINRRLLIEFVNDMFVPTKEG